MVFLSSWCLSFGKIFHYFNLRKESLESVRNVDEEDKERQQPYFHAVAQSGLYAYCLIPARHLRKLSFPLSCHGFLIIGTTATIKSLGMKNFIYIFYI